MTTKAELEELVWDSIDDHDKYVDMYLAGNESIINFLVGDVVRRSHGAADPEEVRDLVKKALTSIKE